MALCTTALVGIVVLLVVMTGKACGGWSLVKNDLDRSNFAKYGYDMAYSMGGDLTGATNGGKPGFLISAVRDPEGDNLDRGQVVKGWIEADGSTRERVRRELYQCHWFPLPPDILGRQGHRPYQARLLLCSRFGDSDPALDNLRRKGVVQREDSRGRARGRSGTCLHLADLVYTVNDK